MNFNSILTFTTQVFGQYAQSNVWSYLFLPVFCFAVVICLIRVVKFIVSNHI